MVKSAVWRYSAPSAAVEEGHALGGGGDPADGGGTGVQVRGALPIEGLHGVHELPAVFTGPEEVASCPAHISAHGGVHRAVPAEADGRVEDLVGDGAAVRVQ